MKLQSKDHSEIFIMKGAGTLSLNQQKTARLKKPLKKKVSQLGLIASGTGISAFIQILEAISMEKRDNMSISFLYVNNKMEDLLLMDELVKFFEDNKLSLNFLQEEPTKFWKGLKTKLTKDVFEDYMPTPTPETMVLFCTNNDIKTNCLKYCDELGYTNENIFSM